MSRLTLYVLENRKLNLPRGLSSHYTSSDAGYQKRKGSLIDTVLAKQEVAYSQKVGYITEHKG